MTDRSLSARPTALRGSSALAPTSRSSDAGVRPRNRRLISGLEDGDDERDGSPRRGRDNNVYETSSSTTLGQGLLASLTPSSSRSVSPFHSLTPNIGPKRTASAANLTNFLNDSFTQSWASVQGFATSLVSGEDTWARSGRSQSSNRAGSGPGTWGRAKSSSKSRKKDGDAWGPAPPAVMPGLGDVASGSLEERDAALKAARRARILESHDELNGGLDATGNHKRRNSDESVPVQQAPVEEYLVYIHYVQPEDTYAGLILRYRCREDAFRKANGLWSRDSVQMRKYLTIPVDACEIRGRPCDPPSWHNSHSVDLLAHTPSAADENRTSQTTNNYDFFTQPKNGAPAEAKPAEAEEKPWTHVRWVKIDSFPKPVEIARVARNAMGYFPPRRKKSIRTISSLSTPRQSFDLPSNPPGSTGGASSRRQSSLSHSHRPRLSGTWSSSPGRGHPEGMDGVPTWMRRPGGVGSMGNNVRAPGPDRDPLSTWTKKHMPGLNLDSLPSMSVMGSETAQFGFKGEHSTELVESHAGEGQDVTSARQQGSGLDKAAAAVETWLRGALSRGPGTPLSGPRAKSTPDGDLIELTDTASDDGKLEPLPASLMESLAIGSSGRSEGDSSVRGRTKVKGGKDD